MNKFTLLMFFATGLVLAILGAMIFNVNLAGISLLPLGSQQQKLTNIQESDEQYYLRGAIDDQSDGKKVLEANRKYVCGTSPDGNTQYIIEYSIPFLCSQPVGIAVDGNDRIWIAATWMGYLLVFDKDTQSFTEKIRIPDWKTKGIFGSMVWDMKFDKDGNLWFTDQVSNAIWRYRVIEKSFTVYRIPTANSYPLSLAFDPQGKVWFSEIFGKKIGVIDPQLTNANTTKGIIEYEVPGLEFETMGSLTISRDGRTIWFTAVNFPKGGNIAKFDIREKRFQVYSLPEQAVTPVGIAEDERGQLWINDHATNLFFKFDPSSRKITKYSTSLPTSRNNTTTLPYWNIVSKDRLWFNEHEGNAIAYYDTARSTLVEYQIPTRTSMWGNTSNPLQFAVDSSGSIWFTEWTENKMGVLRADRIDKLPLFLELSKPRLELDRRISVGQESLDIYVYSNESFSDAREVKQTVKMTVAGSLSGSGRLWNITGEFNNAEFYLTDDGTPTVVNLRLQISDPGLVPGNYTLTVGARYGTVTFNKIIPLSIK